MVIASISLFVLAFPTSHNKEASTLEAKTFMSSDENATVSQSAWGTVPSTEVYPYCMSADCPVEWTRATVIAEENMRAPSGCQASTYAPHCAGVGNSVSDNQCMKKFDSAAKSVCDKLCEWHRWADFETEMAQIDGALAGLALVPGAGQAVAGLSAISAIAQADGAKQADNWAVTGSANTDLTIALSICVSEIPGMIENAIANKNHEDYEDKWENYQEKMRVVQRALEPRGLDDQHGIWITGGKYLKDNGYPNEDFCDYNLNKCECPDPRAKTMVTLSGGRGKHCFGGRAKLRDGSWMEPDDDGVCRGPAQRKVAENFNGKCYFRYGGPASCGTCMGYAARKLREDIINDLYTSVTDSHSGAFYQAMVSEHREIMHRIFEAVNDKEDIPSDADDPTTPKWKNWIKTFELSEAAMTSVVALQAMVGEQMTATVKRYDMYCSKNSGTPCAGTPEAQTEVMRQLKTMKEHLVTLPSYGSCVDAYKHSANSNAGDILAFIKDRQELDENGEFWFYPRTEAEQNEMAGQTHQAAPSNTKHFPKVDAPKGQGGTDGEKTITYYKIQGMTEERLQEICRAEPLWKALVKIDTILLRQVRELPSFGLKQLHSPYLGRPWKTRLEMRESKPIKCCVRLCKGFFAGDQECTRREEYVDVCAPMNNGDKKCYLTKEDHNDVFRTALDEQSNSVYGHGHIQSGFNSHDIGNEATKLDVLRALPHDEDPTTITIRFNSDSCTHTCDNCHSGTCSETQEFRNEDYHQQDIASSYDYCDIKIFDDHFGQVEHQDHVDLEMGPPGAYKGRLWHWGLGDFLKKDYAKDILGICFHRSPAAGDRLAKLEA